MATEIPFAHAIPRRIVEWETEEDSRITLKVPRFGNKYAAAALRPFLSKPDIRVTLDEVGSRCWMLCDGVRSIIEIVKEMRDTFGPAIEPAEERVEAFIRSLEQRASLTISTKNE